MVVALATAAQTRHRQQHARAQCSLRPRVATQLPASYCSPHMRSPCAEARADGAVAAWWWWHRANSSKPTRPSLAPAAQPYRPLVKATLPRRYTPVRTAVPDAEFFAGSGVTRGLVQSARAKLGARRDKGNRATGLTEEQKQEIRCVPQRACHLRHLLPLPALARTLAGSPGRFSVMCV